MQTEHWLVFVSLILLSGSIVIIGAFTASPGSPFKKHVSMLYLRLPSKVQSAIDSLTMENAQWAFDKYSNPEEYDTLLNQLGTVLQLSSAWTVRLIEAGLAAYHHLLLLLASFRNVLVHRTTHIWHRHATSVIPTCIATLRHLLTVARITIAESCRTTTDLHAILSPQVGPTAAWSAILLHAYGFYRILALGFDVVAAIARAAARTWRWGRDAAGRVVAMMRRVGLVRVLVITTVVLAAGVLVTGWMALDLDHDAVMAAGGGDQKGVLAFEPTPTLPLPLPMPMPMDSPNAKFKAKYLGAMVKKIVGWT